MYGGNNRVIAFFSENLGKVVHRSVVLSLLHDQLDPMKRLRWNSGAKGKLWDKEIVLLSGMYFRELADLLGSRKGIPDSWEFSGRKTAAYRQVGNAFPPPVAAAVAAKILEAIVNDMGVVLHRKRSRPFTEAVV